MASLLNLRGRVHRDVLRIIRRYLSTGDVECCFAAHGCVVRDVSGLGSECARSDYVERLQWLREQWPHVFDLFSFAWFVKAMKCDQLHATQFLAPFVKGPNFTPTMDDLLRAVHSASARVFDWFLSLNPYAIIAGQACTRMASERGYVGILRVLATRKLLDKHAAMYYAALFGQLPALRCLHYELNLPFDRQAAHAAISSGNTTMVEWMLDRGCPCKVSMLFLAQRRGDVPMMQLLQEKLDQ